MTIEMVNDNDLQKIESRMRRLKKQNKKKSKNKKRTFELSSET